MPEIFPEVLWLSSVDSTNTRAKQLIKEGGGEGLVIVAETQTAGRGRGKRTWHSNPGGLYFSVVWKSPKRPTDFSFLACVAVCQTLKLYLPNQHETSVKWPNDCLINYKKTAGILSETVEDFCVVGIGININQNQADLDAIVNPIFPATSLSVVTEGTVFDIKDIFNACLQKLFDLYLAYLSDGFDPIRHLWQSNCRLIGKQIELRERGYKDTLNETLTSDIGIFRGIDEMGGLILERHNGNKDIFYTGEITCFWL